MEEARHSGLIVNGTPGILDRSAEHRLIELALDGGSAFSRGNPSLTVGARIGPLALDRPACELAEPSVVKPQELAGGFRELMTGECSGPCRVCQKQRFEQMGRAAGSFPEGLRDRLYAGREHLRAHRF